MATDEPARNGNRQMPAKQCNLLELYLKDVSFEAPHVPRILFGHEQPKLIVAIHNTYTLSVDGIPDRLGDVYDVDLQLSVQAMAGEKRLFLVEVKQSGLFELLGYQKDEADFVLRTKAVETLYPYGRELVNSLVGHGGFPRLTMRPRNFENLYSQALEEYQQPAQLGNSSI